MTDTDSVETFVLTTHITEVVQQAKEEQQKTKMSFTVAFANALIANSKPIHSNTIPKNTEYIEQTTEIHV
jgi:hypothetical protein